jgi:transposase
VLSISESPNQEAEMSNVVPQANDTTKSVVMYVAVELSSTKWKLGFTVDGGRVRVVSIDAGDLAAFESAIGKARGKLGVPSDAPVRSCYEAGRDGFWLHRELCTMRIENVVVDSSSIEVNRRARHAKTDRLDVTKLVAMLVRHWRGGERVWSVVRVPSAEVEDERRLHRELERLKKERTSHRCRIKGLLVLHGLSVERMSRLDQILPTLRLRDGSALPARLADELRREHQRLKLVEEQIGAIGKEREEKLAQTSAGQPEQVKLLMQLVGVGIESAWPFVHELFGWREFRNRRELAAAVGLAPTPYSSGSEERDQGISKSGNRRVRSALIQVAWGWLRFQPESALSQWFQRRFGAGKGRMKRIGIVALARRLLIALWRFVQCGVVPEGARLRAAE